jgi:hypothetical protein
VKAAALAIFLLGCGPKAPAAPPKPKSAPLDTSSLTAITQGPGVRWAIVAAPQKIFTGPLAPYVSKLLPASGLDKLSVRLGFDLRAASSAVMAGFAATTFYAARLPEGTAPTPALEAFEKRIIPPIEKSNPRPDLVRVIGGMPAGARGSAVGMWSSRGDAIVGESGRLGPAVAAMALAAGKLSAERSLAHDKTLGPLLTWGGNAEVSVLARCPVAEALGGTADAEKENVLLQECLGVAITFRAGAPGKLLVSARIAGAWGKDAPIAEDELRATLARVAESDVGRVLGIRDAKSEIHATASAIDATLTVDAAVFSEGLGRVLSQQIGDATK